MGKRGIMRIMTEQAEAEAQTLAAPQKEWPAVLKIAAAVLVVAGLVYILTECVQSGLWYVGLGAAALTACAAFGVLFIWLSNKVSRKKAFEVTVEEMHR